MTNMQALIGLLRLLSASGGEVETRIRIQKEAYLLSLRFPSFFRMNDFEYHHYGPYSRFLSDTLQFAVLSKLIAEVDETPEDKSFTKYRYVLTEKGEEAIGQMPFSDNEFAEFVNRMNAENWRTLELTSTVKYLEIKESMSREDAFKKALKLKPATTSYVKEASALLEEARL